MSRLQDSPVPWAPARRTRPAGTRKHGHEGSQGPARRSPNPAAPRSWLTFSPFSPGRPATPGSPCRLRPSQTAVAPRGVGAGVGRLCWPVTPASPAPTRDAQTAGERDMLALTTPPRGPVFPGEPWRKRGGGGVRGLVSSGPGEARSTGSPQPRLLATRPSAAPPRPRPHPHPGVPWDPQGVLFPRRFAVLKDLTALHQLLPQSLKASFPGIFQPHLVPCLP